MTGTAITGWGRSLPDKVVTNDDLAAYLDTSDEWITERTGIKERRIGGTTSELAVNAAREALGVAGLTGADIDLVILATTTPDQAIPATSSVVHEQLDIRGGAIDLNAACAGFVYAVVIANAMVKANFQRVLVIGSDTLSRVTDQQDRSTAVLFGDGASAIVIEATNGDDLLIAHDLGVDGSAAPLLYADHGDYIQMDGNEVFRRAIRTEVQSITTVLATASLTTENVALFAPHQANLRIIQAVNQRLGISMEKTSIVLDRTGNTSSASVPLALYEAAEHGRLKAGDIALLSGFGAGMTWASALVRWSGRPTGRKDGMPTW